MEGNKPVIRKDVYFKFTRVMPHKTSKFNCLQRIRIVWPKKFIKPIYNNYHIMVKS